MTIPEYASALIWFRRDLRVYDHAALFRALKHARQVFCVFVFDRDILDVLPREDRRVAFIHHSVFELQQALVQQGGGLRYGRARDEGVQLAVQLGVEAVFFNHDDDPAALARDAIVSEKLAQQGIASHSFKDTVIFERDEVLTAIGTPFSVFTPYKNAWLKKIAPFYLRGYPVDRYADRLIAQSSALPSLQEMGFTPLDELTVPPGMSGGAQLFEQLPNRYVSSITRLPCAARRVIFSDAFAFWHDFGAATRCQGLHAKRSGRAYLTELIWRDFYHQILAHHPEVAAGVAIKPQYQQLPWPNPAGHFEAWQQARTGYPLVDAAMRHSIKPAICTIACGGWSPRRF